MELKLKIVEVQEICMMEVFHKKTKTMENIPTRIVNFKISGDNYVARIDMRDSTVYKCIRINGISEKDDFIEVSNETSKILFEAVDNWMKPVKTI